MALTKLDKNLNIVSALDNEPNDVGGLTSEELKSKFDEGGKAIQEYINETLIPETEAAVEEVRGEIEGAVNEAAENLESQLRGVVLGQIPDDTITAEKLTPELRERSYTKEETDAAIETVDKIGDIKTTLRADLGDKWLPCDGREIDKEQYPELYDKYKFGVHASFFPDTEVGANILATHVDEDCVVAIKKINNITLVAYWKMHEDQVWHSQEIFTNTLNTNTGSSRVRVSTVNGKIAVVLNAYYTSYNNYYMYEVHCDKTDFAWSTPNQIYYECYEYYPSPMVYANGYYLVAFADKNGCPHLANSTDLVTWNGANQTIVGKTIGDICGLFYEEQYGRYVIYGVSGNLRRVALTALVQTSSMNEALTPSAETYRAAMRIYDGYCYFAMDWLYNSNYQHDNAVRLYKTPVTNFSSTQASVVKEIRTFGTNTIIDMDIVDGIAYIMESRKIYKIDIETGITDIIDLPFTASQGAISFANGKMLAATPTYHETKNCTPRISIADTNAFIKAKM